MRLSSVRSKGKLYSLVRERRGVSSRGTCPPAALPDRPWVGLLYVDLISGEGREWSSRASEAGAAVLLRCQIAVPGAVSLRATRRSHFALLSHAQRFCTWPAELQCPAQWFCTRNSGLRGRGKASVQGPLQASETRRNTKEKEKKGKILLLRFYFYFPGIVNGLCR